MKIDELKELLDKAGIEYSDKAVKKDLEKLLGNLYYQSADKYARALNINKDNVLEEYVKLGGNLQVGFGYKPVK